MASHVTRTDWLCDGTKKGKNLVYQHETIVYEVPLPKVFKSRLIAVLKRFYTDFGCKLTVRGRKEFEQKRVKIEKRQETEVDKIHEVTLNLLENKQQTAQERLRALCRAETFVDAFLTQLLVAPEDNVYMFPPEQTAPRTDAELAGEKNLEQKPARCGS